MNDGIEKIKEWAQEMENYEAIPWDRLPEIDLYMDQVITYMDRQLDGFQRIKANKLLTPSMINNYVKDKVLDRPEQKKYSRNHLAILTFICMLKPVLAIQDISSLLHALLQDDTKQELYDTFCSFQSQALHEVCGQVLATAEKGKPELIKLAVLLSVEANARRTAAERIVAELLCEAEEKEDTKNKQPGKPKG